MEGAGAPGAGGVEGYGYQTIETLLGMVEGRWGGETGVTGVECLEGDAVWQARDGGLWPAELAEAEDEAVEPDGNGVEQE